MKYTTSYTSSKGQTSKGHETHETMNDALKAWEANIGSIQIRGGGKSKLKAWEDGDLESEHAEPAGSISWLEHCEGGYACADGIFSDEMMVFAMYELGDGEELTAEKVVRLFSE